MAASVNYGSVQNVHPTALLADLCTRPYPCGSRWWIRIFRLLHFILFGAGVTTVPPEFEDQLDTFLRLAGKQIFCNPSAADFTAWVQPAAPKIFPAFFEPDTG
jgi:hypothetical protein